MFVSYRYDSLGCEAFLLDACQSRRVQSKRAGMGSTAAVVLLLRRSFYIYISASLLQSDGVHTSVQWSNKAAFYKALPQVFFGDLAPGRLPFCKA